MALHPKRSPVSILGILATAAAAILIPGAAGGAVLVPAGSSWRYDASGRDPELHRSPVSGGPRKRPRRMLHADG
jgi:hypothetical protein